MILTDPGVFFGGLPVSVMLLILHGMLSWWIKDDICLGGTISLVVRLISFGGFETVVVVASVGILTYLYGNIYGAPIACTAGMSVWAIAVPGIVFSDTNQSLSVWCLLFMSILSWIPFLGLAISQNNATAFRLAVLSFVYNVCAVVVLVIYVATFGSIVFVPTATSTITFFVSLSLARKVLAKLGPVVNEPQRFRRSVLEWAEQHNLVQYQMVSRGNEQ